jgi:hypothetical protein
MLHENSRMLDIDVDHWRNLQSLFLQSAKAKRRIIVIHEGGEVQKFVHSQREEIAKPITRIDDPHAAAKAIFEANPGKAEFVAVFERNAFDRYFGEFQDTWRSDEDLDTFVRRTYALMDKYPDGIVTYPGPARDVLGMQWRVGASYAEVEAAAAAFVSPDSSVVIGIFEGDALWATLVLHFDADLRADAVTTIDPSLISATGRAALADAAVAQVEAKYGAASLALFTDLDGARAFIAAPDKVAAVASLASRGALIPLRVPANLATHIPA